MVSLLYDIAGRSEDAFHLSWDRIKYSEAGGGYAELIKGKSSSRRVIFSPLTEELLREHAGPGSCSGLLFAFNSVNSMRVWLDRFVKKITLPKHNKIVV